MKSLPVVLALVVAGCSPSGDSKAPVPSPTAPADARWITDAGGRALILRGMNMSGSAKSDPLRSPNLTDADITRVSHHYGFDFARYLVLWDALEPEAGKIDMAYVDRIATDVKRLGDAGVRVMLDLHQDVYAAQFCCDGAPAWAVRDDGQPFELQKTWSFNYFQPAVTRAFDNFWDAKGKDADLQEHYAAVWKALATRFAGDPHLIGYDLINEPYAGSDFEALEVLSRVTPEDGGKSRIFDETKLGPFYQRMIDAIRTVDADHWIFVEPRYGAPGNGSPSFLPVLKDPRAGELRIVQAPHLYSTSGEAFGYAPDDPTVSFWEQERTKERAAQRGPLLMGEWWAYSWTQANARPFAEGLLAMADRMEIGWAYWSYGSGPPESAHLFADDGTDNPAADVVVRPYPRVIAGEPMGWSFDPATRVLDLKVDEKAGVSGATEVFLPEARTYPKGWSLTVDSDPEGAWSSTFDKDTGVLSIKVDPGTAHHHVRVAPKP